MAEGSGAFTSDFNKAANDGAQDPDSASTTDDRVASAFYVANNGKDGGGSLNASLPASQGDVTGIFDNAATTGTHAAINGATVTANTGHIQVDAIENVTVCIFGEVGTKSSRNDPLQKFIALRSISLSSSFGEAWGVISRSKATSSSARCRFTLSAINSSTYPEGSSTSWQNKTALAAASGRRAHHK